MHLHAASLRSRSHPSIHPSIDLQLAVAAVLLGVIGTNVCPAGSVSVGTEAECRSAATALGLTYTGVTLHWGNSRNMPKGCFVFVALQEVYFNAHETGGTHTGLTPICAGACSGSRPFVYVCVSVHVCVHVSQCTSGYHLPSSFLLPFMNYSYASTHQYKMN